MEGILRDNLIKFTNPDKFNDPFECLSVKPTISIKQTEDNIREHMPLYKNINTSIPQDLVEKYRLAIGLEYKNSWVPKYGILSLSSTWKDILMWSHYASHHRGLLLEFNYIPTTSFYKDRLIRVHYTNEVSYFESDTVTDPRRKAEEMFSTKHTIWGHEKEFRVVNVPSVPTRADGNGLKKFDKDLLTGITFGLKTSQKDIEKVKNWVNSYSPSIALSKIYIGEQNIELKQMKL